MCGRAVTSSLAESLGGGSPDAWAYDWLVVAGFPTTPSNVLVVVSWEYAESGGGGGMWNPLNTTQGWPGATDVNSVGVKNYAQRSDGLAANAHVIHNGLYGPVVSAFDRGDNAAATVQAIVTSPWGTRRINLRGTVPPPHPIPAPQPLKVSEMQTFPSHTKPPTKFRGAWVWADQGRVALVGGAVTVPAYHPPGPGPWASVYERTDGKAGFVIVPRLDLDEYAFELP
jgi:hypothetical protein